MKIISIITDYIKGSLLTTKGDIIKHDGVSAKKLGIGAAGQMLAVDNLGVDLEYQGAGGVPSQFLRFGVGAAGVHWEDPGTFQYENVFSAKNIAEKTLLVSGILILELDLGNVLSGDQFNIEGQILCVNDANAGDITIVLQKHAGTATFTFLHDKTGIFHKYYVVASKEVTFNLGTVLNITGSGTLILEIKGYKNPNNATVSINECQLYINQTKKITA